jgi:hypothetical protein
MDADWLKTQLILNPGKSKADLARAVGLSPPAISKILKGTRQIKAQEYVLMREFFGMPNDGHAAARRLPLSQSPKDNSAFQESKSAPGEWLIPSSLTSDPDRPGAAALRVFEVHETFMEPDFKKGERVLADLNEKTPARGGVFVISDGFSNMLRCCEVAAQPGKVKLFALNSFEPQTLSANEFLIIGRVIAKLSAL